MHFAETVAIYLENRMKHTNTVRGKAHSFLMLQYLVYIIITEIWKVMSTVKFRTWPCIFQT